MANLIHELFRHNRWANDRVFKVCMRAEMGLIEEQAAGTVGTVIDSLRHMVSVEEAFTPLVAGVAGQSDFVSLVTRTGLADDYLQHDLPWYQDRAARLDENFLALSGGASPDLLDACVSVPWMGIEVTVQQAWTQVLGHSGHHRSQVFSALGERGVKVPDLDYIVMLAKEQKAPAT